MAATEESTSFIQFDYCNLCKISHKKRKKHLYSKRHQEILQNILKKFLKKIKDAKSCLNNPVIEMLGWENGAQFWCYFCEMEIDKHRQEIDATVKYGGLLQHIASKEHVKKAGEFFWKNIIDKNKKNNYILREIEAERFTNKSETALTVYRQKMEAHIQQIADKIRKQTNKQDQLIQTTMAKAPPWSQMCTKQTQISQHSSPSHVTPQGESSEVPRRKIVQAVAVGLTSIAKPISQTSSSVDKEEVGNVFTGATPPWLMDEEEQTGGGEIGPSITEYNKHLKREEKKKLPPNRVGVKFDHTSQTSATWMPSFSGVWNKGRRLDSKIQFDKRLGIKGHRGHGSDMMQPFARSSIPSTVVPYKRKNKTETNPAVTEMHLIDSPLVDSRSVTTIGSSTVNLKNSQHQMSDYSHHVDMSGLQAISSPLVESRSVTTTGSFSVNPKNSHHVQSVSNYTHSVDMPGLQAISSEVIPDTFDSVRSTHLSSSPATSSVLVSTSASGLNSRNTSSSGKPGPVIAVSHPPIQTSGCRPQAHLTGPKSKTDVIQGEESLRQTNSESVVNQESAIKETIHTASETEKNSSARENILTFVDKSNNKASNEIKTKKPMTPSTQPSSVIPYKRKKKVVHSSEPPTSRVSDSSCSDVGQMFTQACDMAFRQQTQNRGNIQEYSNSQNFHNNQNMYQQNQNHNLNQFPNQYPNHLPQGQQWMPQSVPRHFTPQYGNNKYRSPGQMTPQFIHSPFVNPHTTYPGVHRGVAQVCMPPQRLAAPPVVAGAGAGAGAGVSQGQAQAQTGGLNLFQSISAAIGTKLPN